MIFGNFVIHNAASPNSTKGSFCAKLKVAIGVSPGSRIDAFSDTTERPHGS